MITLKKIAGNLAFQVLVAILSGAAVGHFFPSTGIQMEIVGKSFVDILKLFIAPIIFLTITLGIGGIGDLKKVGRVGLKALIYFEVVTTFALGIGVLVALKADPNNPAHQELAKNIAMHIAATRPQFLDRTLVPTDVLEREREVLTEKTRAEGKPEAALAKIVEGRINKFYEDTCLVDQPYVRDTSKKIGQLASEAGAEVTRFALFQVGQE